VQKGYRITRHAGHTADSATATLLCTSPDEMSAWRYFQATVPVPGMSLALWKSDGSILAFRSGPARPSS
jgi:hypothetical protein